MLVCPHGSFGNGFLLSGSEGNDAFLACVNFDCYNFMGKHTRGGTTLIAGKKNDTEARHKKPGLRTEDVFVILFFMWDDWTGR